MKVSTKDPSTMGATETHWEMSELYDFIDNHDVSDSQDVADDIHKAEVRLTELNNYLFNSIADLSFLTNGLLDAEDES